MKLKTICCEPERISKTYFTGEIIIQKYFIQPSAPYRRKTGKKQGVKLLILVQGVSKRKYIIQAGSSVSQCLTVYKPLVYNLSF